MSRHRATAPHEQELVSRYGSASAGIVEAVKRLIATPK